MEPYRFQKELDIYAEAQAAAAAATQAYLLAGNDWYPCGFSWVRIRPARGRFVEMCKDRQLGSTDDFGGGFVIYNPSGNHTQSMDAKKAGSDAFVEVMKKHYPTLKISAQTRMD